MAYVVMATVYRTRLLHMPACMSAHTSMHINRSAHTSVHISAPCLHTCATLQKKNGHAAAADDEGMDDNVDDDDNDDNDDE